MVISQPFLYSSTLDWLSICVCVCARVVNEYVCELFVRVSRWRSFRNHTCAGANKYIRWGGVSLASVSQIDAGTRLVRIKIAFRIHIDPKRVDCRVVESATAISIIWWRWNMVAGSVEWSIHNFKVCAMPIIMSWWCALSSGLYAGSICSVWCNIWKSVSCWLNKWHNRNPHSSENVFAWFDVKSRSVLGTS